MQHRANEPIVGSDSAHATFFVDQLVFNVETLTLKLAHLIERHPSFKKVSLNPFIRFPARGEMGFDCSAVLQQQASQ
jgi:hypothetical protein